MPPVINWAGSVNSSCTWKCALLNEDIDEDSFSSCGHDAVIGERKIEARREEMKMTKKKRQIEWFVKDLRTAGRLPSMVNTRNNRPLSS